MKKILGFILFFVFSVQVFAQFQERWWEARSAPFHLRMEDPQEALRQLEADNRRNQELWASELAAQRAALSEDRRISDAITMTATPSVSTGTTESGNPEMNLNINFTYSTHPEQSSVSIVADDYPLGRYNPNHSNASRLMLEFARNKIETEMAQYFTPGRRITINITGETDGAPVLGLPYFGEYGNFHNSPVILNGRPSQITVTSDEGISTNAQLGFLRAQGIEDFLKRSVAPLRATNNTYQIFANENIERGGQFRRISVEMTIHGAFNERFNMLPQDSDDNNDDALSMVRVILPTVTGPAARNFSHMRLQQHDGMLLVIYDLAAMADVEMHVSFDNGNRFMGPLEHVMGAVGLNVAPGKDRIIMWNVVEEVGYVDHPQTVIKLIGVERDEEEEVEIEEVIPGAELSRMYYKNVIRLEGGAGIPVSRIDEPYKGYNFHIGGLYTYNFSPYFGLDLIKLKFEHGRAHWNDATCLNCDLERNITSIQAMTGFRLSTPHFGKEKNTNAFTALRGGISHISENGSYWTIGGREGKVAYKNEDIDRFRACMEWDVGIQYKRVYFALSLNGFYVRDLLHRDWRPFFPFHGIKIGVDILRKNPVYY